MLHTHTDDLEIQRFSWGTLQWLASATLFPGAEQTVGICHLNAGQANPLHYHPNCEEILIVERGSGRHLLDEAWILVRPGSIVRIPRGMKHKLINESSEPMITTITFSAGDRETVFLE